MQLRRFIQSLLLLAFITSFIQFTPEARAEAQFQTSQVQALLASMTPEERVGQLFLVTFQGVEAHDQTEIYDLIDNFHVGGVVLLAGNDNFLPAPDTVPTAHQLISTLQTIEAETAAPVETGAQAEGNVYVPLFVGISQEGDGTPHDQILSGLTPLPNLMAIGATWDRDLAQQVGAVLGNELSALGLTCIWGPRSTWWKRRIPLRSLILEDGYLAAIRTGWENWDVPIFQDCTQGVVTAWWWLPNTSQVAAIQIAHLKRKWQPCANRLSN
jgi:hypothetical protein